MTVRLSNPINNLDRDFFLMIGVKNDDLHAGSFLSR